MSHSLNDHKAEPESHPVHRSVLCGLVNKQTNKRKTLKSKRTELKMNKNLISKEKLNDLQHSIAQLHLLYFTVGCDAFLLSFSLANTPKVIPAFTSSN